MEETEDDKYTLEKFIRELTHVVKVDSNVSLLLYDVDDLEDYYFRFASSRLDDGLTKVIDFSMDDDESVKNYVTTAGGRYDNKHIDVNDEHSWEKYKDLEVIPSLELTHLKTQHYEKLETGLKELKFELRGEEYADAAICVLIKGLHDRETYIEVPIGSGKSKNTKRDIKLHEKSPALNVVLPGEQLVGYLNTTPPVLGGK